MRTLLISLVCVMLTGCATGKTWYHPDPERHTEQAFYADQSACMTIASQVVGEARGTLGTVEYAVWQRQTQVQYERCMMSRGWQYK
jgi:hypothetical protein